MCVVGEEGEEERMQHSHGCAALGQSLSGAKTSFRAVEMGDTIGGIMPEVKMPAAATTSSTSQRRPSTSKRVPMRGIPFGASNVRSRRAVGDNPFEQYEREKYRRQPDIAKDRCKRGI